MRVLHNKTPCCNGPTHMQHERYDDDAELTWPCKGCGREFRVTFSKSKPLKGLGEFRVVHWEPLTGPGGRTLDERVPDEAI